MPVEIVDTADGLERIADRWEALWRRDANATPFQSPQWLLSWWKHFGSDTPHVIASSTNDTFDALAPLYILRDDDSGESLGMFLGTGNSDYLDVLGDASQLIESITGADCQLWDLQQLRPSSSLLSVPLPDGWSDNVEDQDPCPVLPIENAGEELQNLLSTHARKKLRYFRRCLEREGEVRYESATAESLDALLDALFELHAARWQKRGLPGVLADEVTQSFHRDVARRMLDAGALRMYAIRIGDRIVGVFYGFAHQGTVYYYLSGYDPALEKLSLGNVIVAHAIEDAVREGATTFDFLRGAEEYKYSWGAKDRMNRRRQLFSV
ncbi:MAG TPA: GNAT family N-acetyltransferase [Thermoanaerobaculia bacterium]|nr:GNAT family N-acetyltransferase [Thermoanaerobaculia bacterium]